MVAHYLTIPEVTDAEEIVAVSQGSSEHSFDIVINAGEASAWLFRAAAAGTIIPLVVLVTDAMTIALDDVVVSTAEAGTPVYAQVAFTLDAGSVRVI